MVSPRAIVDLAVAIGVFNLLTVAKHRAFASADGHLGTAVAIEVGNSEARRVTQNDARSALDAPEQSAIELVGIPDNSPETVLLRVAGSRAVADDVAVSVFLALQSFHDDFKLSIAVEVAYTHIVGRIDNLSGVLIHVLRVLQRDADVRQAAAHLRTFQRERGEGVATAGIGQAIVVVGRGAGRAVLKAGAVLDVRGDAAFLAVARSTIEVEPCRCIVAGQHAPADKHLSCVLLVVAQRSILGTVDACPEGALVEVVGLS